MKSIRLAIPVCTLLVCTGAALPAFADVTLKAKSSGKGPIGGMNQGETTTYIKGLKFRSDSVADGKSFSMLMDAGGTTMTMLRHDKKEADVFNMAEAAEEISKMVSISDIKITVNPTGQTRQIAGTTCAVHDVAMTMPVKIANMAMTMSSSGPYCLAKNGPGHADYAAFYKAAADKGFIFADPRAAKAGGGQFRGMTEMYRKMAELGVPLAMDIVTKMEGEGPMAGIMGRMGNGSMSSEAISISTDAIADAMFEIPAGYKINKK
jgi:hypothetical protein